MSGLERLFRKQIVYHNRLTNKTDDRIETIRVFYFNKNILLIHHTTNLKELRKSEGGGTRSYRNTGCVLHKTLESVISGKPNNWLPYENMSRPTGLRSKRILLPF